MKIGIVLHPYAEKAPAGLGRIILELTLELMRHYPNDQYLVYVKGHPALPHFPAKDVTVVHFPTGPLWLDRGFFRAPRADVTLFNTPVLPLIVRVRNPVVMALDFAYWQATPPSLRSAFFRRVLFAEHRRSLRCASRIVAISRATARETERLFFIPREKVQTIYFGFKNVCAIAPKPLDIPDNYFLFPGVW